MTNLGARRRRYSKRYKRQGLPWSQAELNRLGKAPDAEVATKTGHTEQAVKLRRLALRLPMPNSKIYFWQRKNDKLLGVLPDHECAARIGCKLTSVEQRRRKLGIRSVNPRGLRPNA